MTRDHSTEELPTTRQEWLTCLLVALGLTLAVCVIGPRDMEASEVTAQTMVETVAVVQAAQGVTQLTVRADSR